MVPIIGLLTDMLWIDKISMNTTSQNFRSGLRHLLTLMLNLLALAMPLSVSGQLIVAHRGASFVAPENTLAAFDLAWKENADAIEGDFRLTGDGHIVCIHDATTKRTSGVDCEIASSTLAELQQLDVGSWKHERYSDQRIPTLDQVLEIVPSGKKIFIELKAGPEIVLPLKKVLANGPLKSEQMVIIAFDEATVREAKKSLPQVKAHWLTGYDSDKKSNSDAYDRITKTLGWCRADGLGSQAKRECFNEDLVKRMKRGGFPEFHVWTVDDPDDARFYAELGAYGITTNRPAFIRKHLNLQR